MADGGKLVFLADRRVKNDVVTKYLSELSKKDFKLVLRLVLEEASRRIEEGK